MRRYVIKCITCLGLVFFLTLFVTLLTSDATASATTITNDVPSEQVVSDQTTDMNIPVSSEASSEVPLPDEMNSGLPIKLNVKNKALVKETSYALKVYNVTDTQDVLFRSDNPEIASVNAKGIVTANTVGTTFITVTVLEEEQVIATLQCVITVGPPAISIKLVRSEIVLSVGRKTSLKTILQPNNTVEEAQFCSYDPEIASVSAGGRVNAKKIGVTYIYVGIANGKYELCKVTVVENETPEEIEIFELIPVETTEELIPIETQPTVTPEVQPEAQNTSEDSIVE